MLLKYLDIVSFDLEYFRLMHSLICYIKIN